MTRPRPWPSWPLGYCLVALRWLLSVSGKPPAVVTAVRLLVGGRESEPYGPLTCAGGIGPFSESAISTVAPASGWAARSPAAGGALLPSTAGASCRHADGTGPAAFAASLGLIGCSKRHLFVPSVALCSWLVMHVSVIMVSYDRPLLVGSLLSRGGAVHRSRPGPATASARCGSGGFPPGQAGHDSGGGSPAEQRGDRIKRATRRLSYRTITVAFAAVRLGLVSGASGANELGAALVELGTEKTWALDCWLVYAAYLQTRA